MLANFSRYDGVVVRELTQFFDYILWLDLGFGCLVTHWLIFTPGSNFLKPRSNDLMQRRDFVLVLSQFFVQFLQYIPQVTDDRQVYSHVLLDRRWVDINMNDLGVRGKGCNLASDAIVKASPQGNQKVRVGHCHIGVVGAVHTKHTEREFMLLREACHPHQSRGDRHIQLFGKLEQFSMSIRQ